MKTQIVRPYYYSWSRLPSGAAWESLVCGGPYPLYSTRGQSNVSVPSVITSRYFGLAIYTRSSPLAYGAKKVSFTYCRR
jgi:hypothetical protein